jgi:ketosteroid isomerase-like protein
MRSVAQQHVRAVGRFYSAWSRGDLHAMLRLVDPAVTAEAPLGFLGAQRTYCGRDGISAIFGELAAGWDHTALAIRDIEQRGDVVTARVQLAAHRAGETVAGRSAIACRFRRGRIVSIERA